MKVILMKDVARIGRRFEVKEVPVGHALNFLIPRKLAIIATPESMKRLGEQKSKQAHSTEEEDRRFNEAVTMLGEKPLVMTVQANAQGHLFKGIKADDIARTAVNAGAMIHDTHIVLDHPIKQVGDHMIELVSGDKHASFTLQVIAQ